jgi:prolyl-tRNA synthetase
MVRPPSNRGDVPPMRLSRYFLPVLKEAPAEAEIVSHKLMLRAGMIQQLSAGIYNWLPLGFAVLQKVEQIVREEMNAAGAIEIMMPTIQPADLWRESGRYEAYGKEMLRIQDRHERDMLYGPTNEENVTDIFRRHVKSYRQLPLNLYHIQWKFRDEIRPRFGVMRGREFLMKDAYSFDVDHEAARRAYDNMFLAYLRTFKRMGLTAIPMQAETGPIGGNMSHEFQILAQTGESAVYYDAAFEQIDFAAPDLDPERLKSLYAAADEKHDPAACPIPADRLRSGRGIEVGHIFHFGTKYSKAMGATVMAADGTEVPVEMGSYGIGVSRLVGALIEAFHDDKGIVWPESVAPFKLGLVNLRPDDATTTALAEDLYGRLRALGVEVLMDDRDERAGVKFATMELIGLPWQVVVGPRGAAEDRVELKNRATGEKEDISAVMLVERFAP